MYFTNLAYHSYRQNALFSSKIYLTMIVNNYYIIKMLEVDISKLFRCSYCAVLINLSL